MDIEKYLKGKKEIVDGALEKCFSKEMEFPPSLYKAIRYSLFNGGKRIRPILSIAAFEAVGGQGEGLLPLACGLEMIHAYSLIHDDLPAIDNDDYRRRQLTCHKGDLPLLLGVEESRRRAKELIESAIEALSSFGPEADPLREIARFIIGREY